MTQRTWRDGKLYYGAAGAQAATLIENVLDCDWSVEPIMDDTTVRGDGSELPVESGAPVARKASLKFTLPNDSADATCTALRAAAAAATPVAILVLDVAGGKGIDADIYISCRNGHPNKGKQTFEFGLVGVSRGRTPGLNAEKTP